MPSARAPLTLITVAQAAELLAVREKTIRRWLADDRIPYLKLPGGSYRIPQGALLASLAGNFALGDEIEALDARLAGISEDDVRAALE